MSPLRKKQFDPTIILKFLFFLFFLHLKHPWMNPPPCPGHAMSGQHTAQPQVNVGGSSPQVHQDAGVLSQLPGAEQVYQGRGQLFHDILLNREHLGGSHIVTWAACMGRTPSPWCEKPLPGLSPLNQQEAPSHSSGQCGPLSLLPECSSSVTRAIGETQVHTCRCGPSPHGASPAHT